MAAHQEISLAGYMVRSYGTGKEVAGRSAMGSVVFSFNTPYEYMHGEMRRRDATQYVANRMRRGL